MNKIKEEYKFIFVYLTLGLTWVIFSDTILTFMLSDIDNYNQIQLYKEIFYVIITAIFYFYFIKKYTVNVRDKQHKLKSNSEKISRINEELKDVLKETKTLNMRFIKMINTISTLNKENSLEEEVFLKKLLIGALDIIPEADYGKIYLVGEEKLDFIDTLGHDLESLRNIEIDSKHIRNNGDKDIHKANDYSININSLSMDKKKKLKQSLKAIKESRYIDIKTNNEIVGRISLSIADNSEKEFAKTTDDILESFSTLASSFFSYKSLEKLNGQFTKDLISSIINIMEMYDLYTKGHSENVANLSLIIAEEMNLTDEMILDSYWAGMLHDIGKLLIPIDILNKNESLTKEEYDLIKKHPELSSRALSGSKNLNHISEYVNYHHERWDGKGYPDGLEKNEIPLISQIISVSDSWDAMRSDRSYRKALDKESALKEIVKNKGKQFAPEVVEAFVEVINNESLAIEEQAENKVSQLEDFDLEENKKMYFKHLFEHSKEGMVILDGNWRVKDVNKQFTKMFGYRKSEMLGIKLYRLLNSEEEKERALKNIEKLKENQEVILNGYRLGKDGKIIDVNIQAFPVELKKDEVNYYIIYKDISDLKDAKRKYNNYKDRYRALFENKSTVMLIIDPDNGDIIDANPAAVNFYGWNIDKLKSMKISEINILSDEEIKKEIESARIKNKNHFIFEHKLANNYIKEVEVYSQPINIAGKEMLYSIIHETGKCSSY